MEKDINVDDADGNGKALWDGLCQIYSLGGMLSSPQPVSGGLQHKIWRIETPKGEYAVKILDPYCASNDDCCRRCLQGEQIARRAAEAGLPVIVALNAPSGMLQRIGPNAVLCYPWEQGDILPPAPVSPAQAELIGDLMGRLHSLKLSAEEADPSATEWFTEFHWRDIAQRVQKQRLSIAPALFSSLPDLIAWSEATREASACLSQDWVVSHRDLDQKNVLWRDAATPRLIDWEAAGPVHPALEVMGTGLNWAGQSAGPPEEAVFRAFLDGYRRQAPLEVDTLRHAAAAVLGKWLVWLEVCLGRALASELAEERNSVLDSAAHALATLHVLAATTRVRLAWCDVD